MTSISKGRRSAWLWRGAAGLSILVAALALFAWQRGGDGDGPLNAIAAAAERTQGEPGGRATMRSVIHSPKSLLPIVMRGRMVYSGDLSKGVIRFRKPETGEPLEMQLIGSEFVFYMSSSLFADKLPDGRKWMKLDLSFLGEPDESIPTSGDVKGELALLEAVSDEKRAQGSSPRRLKRSRRCGSKCGSMPKGWCGGCGTSGRNRARKGTPRLPSTCASTSSISESNLDRSAGRQRSV